MQPEYIGPALQGMENILEQSGTDETIWACQGMVRNTELAYYIEEEAASVMAFHWGNGWTSYFLVPHHIDMPGEGMYVRVTFKIHREMREIETEYYQHKRKVEVTEQKVIRIEKIDAPRTPHPYDMSYQ